MAEEVLAIWNIAPAQASETSLARKAGREGEMIPGGWASPKIPGGALTAKIAVLNAENKADMQNAIKALFPGDATTVFYVKKANVEE
jgi:hypothetical protein